MPGQCIHGQEQQKIKKKVQSPQTFLDKQSGKIQTFDTYFVFLECLIKNKCRLMIQELSCRNYLCLLHIKLYKKMQWYSETCISVMYTPSVEVYAQSICKSISSFID